MATSGVNNPVEAETYALLDFVLMAVDFRPFPAVVADFCSCSNVALENP
jgi:hypothetical protein